MRFQDPGVNLHDKDKATPDFTLFSPIRGDRVFLIDMDGNPIHEWKLQGLGGMNLPILGLGTCHRLDLRSTSTNSIFPKQRKSSTMMWTADAGTPMGELMRQYWLPAAMSSELTADGDPLRLKLLGEKLIGFRDSSGKVGIMDHRCPHRCASLFFGRNEEGGIRCVYHGWKFDTDGNCLDMANVPPHQDFKHKVIAKSYKTAERNGLIWVFMGDQENVPELSELEATLLPEEEHKIEFVQRECNWLQGLEGEIDTSHGVRPAINPRLRSIERCLLGSTLH